MISYATTSFSYDPDGQFIFPLTVCITEMKTQTLIGMDFCQKQVCGILFESPGIEIKNPQVNLLWQLSPKQILSPFIKNFDYKKALYDVYWR